VKIYTFQMAKRHALDRAGILWFDTTVKSGPCIQVKPTWAMVLGHKNGTISDEEYTERYNEMLERSYATDPRFWEELCAQELIALGCYCRKGAFCHRHLLVEFLRRITTVELLGEFDQ
jgi:hypothetical protein